MYSRILQETVDQVFHPIDGAFDQATQLVGLVVERLPNRLEEVFVQETDALADVSEWRSEVVGRDVGELLQISVAAAEFRERLSEWLDT